MTGAVSPGVRLTRCIQKTEALMCVGLDPERTALVALGLLPAVPETTAPWGEALPPELADPAVGQQLDRALTDLYCALLDTCAEYACAFKTQFAHYAALGAEAALARILRYARQRYPDIPLLLDVKRGDIGSTAAHYAREAFLRYGADGVTLNPYLGGDSLAPFLAWPHRACIVLVKTSNPGSADIQDLPLARDTVDALRVSASPSNMLLYRHLARMLVGLPRQGDLWFVVGGTQADALRALRAEHPDIPFLVPGVGAQGGDIETIVHAALRRPAGDGLAINVSRGIITPPEGCRDTAGYLAHARARAAHYHAAMCTARRAALAQ